MSHIGNEQCLVKHVSDGPRFSRLAVWTLEEPLFFLYDSNQHQYGLYSLSHPNRPLEEILDHLLSHSSQIVHYTGDNRWKRFLRPFWELYRTIVAMFIEAPTITMFVIGLPASILSIVCYCLFCLPNESSMDERERYYGEVEEVNDESMPNELPKSTTDKKDD